MHIVNFGFFGLLAPAGTPRDVVQTLSRHLSLALVDPQLEASVAPTGVDIEDLPMEEFREYVVRRTNCYSKSLADYPAIEKALTE